MGAQKMKGKGDGRVPLLDRAGLGMWLSEI